LQAFFLAKKPKRLDAFEVSMRFGIHQTFSTNSSADYVRADEQCGVQTSQKVSGVFLEIMKKSTKSIIRRFDWTQSV
jgi:hypothetical protein